MSLAMIIALAVMTIVLLILAIVIWNVLAWPALTATRLLQPGAVSVLIPARDEEINIEPCVTSALAQGASVGEVLVYDDGSRDRTGELVRRLTTRDARVTLIQGIELPAGWCGKNHACARLAAAARGPWLLFLDADARLGDDAVERLLAEANHRDVTLLSPWPALVTGTFWERTLMPMLDVLTFSLFPAPLSFHRNDPSLGLVHGACILASAEAYARVGGHAAIRAELLEDQRLAQLWRSRGERGLCVDGHSAVGLRMYRSLGGIWRGFRKNFYPAFRHGASFWAFLLLHVTIFLAPLLLVAFTRAWPALVALAGLFAIRLLLAMRFKHPLWSVVAHPVAEVVLIGIALTSWWRCRTGRGVDWKGRQYQVTSARQGQ